MSAKIFFHIHRLTMCGLKKLASGVLLESWKVLGEQQWQQQKQTKNNKSPPVTQGDLMKSVVYSYDENLQAWAISIEPNQQPGNVAATKVCDSDHLTWLQGLLRSFHDTGKS